MLSDLGFQVPTGSGWTELTNQFTAIELRDSDDLTTAIANADLECSTDGATNDVLAADYDADLALVLELNLREISEEENNELLVDGSLAPLHKHVASGIEIEGTYPNISGTPTDLESTLGSIDTSLGNIVQGHAFSTIYGNTGEATADAAGDSIIFSGINDINTVAEDDPEILTIDGSALLPRDGGRAMTGDFDVGGNSVTNVNLVDGVDVSTLKSDYDTHAGDTSIHFTEGSIDHGSISGLGDDDHPQYTHYDQDETISGVWTFDTEATEPSLVIAEQAAAPTSKNASGAISNVNGILYVYDSSRSKTLSLQRMTLAAGRDNPNATNIYLRAVDNIPTNETGYRMMRDGTITGLSAQTASAESWVFEIRINGSVVASLTVTSAIGNQDTSINVDFNAGDELQFYCNGSLIDKPLGVIEYAWRV